MASRKATPVRLTPARSEPAVSPATRARPAAEPTDGAAERRGWYAIAAITTVLALTWVPLLNAPFGDDHLGRILGRYALHLRNLQEQGVLTSHLGADWAPYASLPYAHHPPLVNLLTALTGLLPGAGEYEVRLPAYLLGLLVVPAGAGLLRGFGLRWPAVLLALGLLVATPFYWAYGPLMFDLGLILLLSATVVRLRRRPDPSRRLVALAVVAALLTTLVSWPGVAAGGGLGLWLLATRRLDRVTALVGAALLAGVVVSLGYVVGVTGLGALGDQAELRSTGGGYGPLGFLRRQLRFATTLYPVWYLLVLPLGVLAGLRDRRTRGYLAAAVVFTAGWILVPNQAAYLHSYWSYPALVVGLVGMAALADRLVVGGGTGGHAARPAAPAGTRARWRWPARAMPPGWPARRPTRRTVRRAAGALVAAGLAGYLGVLVAGPVRRDLLTVPAEAGRLAAEHRPPAGQRYAWTAGDGLTTPRWLAYYWRLAPRELDPEVLGSGRARPEDLVLMDLRARPEWLPESIDRRAVARGGPYAVFRVAELRAAARH